MTGSTDTGVGGRGRRYILEGETMLGKGAKVEGITALGGRRSQGRAEKP